MEPAIFVDLDGCIVPEKGDSSDEYFAGLTLLAKLIRRGNVRDFPRIILCTGRNRSYVDGIARIIGLPDSTCITENGAVFFNPSTQETVINPALTPRTLTRFERIRGKLAPKLAKAHNGLRFVSGNGINITFEYVASATSLTASDLRRIVRHYFAKLIWQKQVKVITCGKTINVVPAKISKVCAVRYLAREEGICLKSSLGIGDTSWDHGFMALTGFCGCPANASNECKDFVRRSSGRVSSKNYVAGVYDIIEHFFGSLV